MITSKPANGPRTQDMNCCTAPTGVSARTFLLSNAENLFSRPKIPQAFSIVLDCFGLVGAAWKPAGEAEAGNAGEQPAKE